MLTLASLRSSRLIPAVLTIALVAPLSSSVARADNAPSPSPGGAGAGYDAALGSPEGGGSASGGGQNLVSVDPSTGTASASIPFALPRARGGAQPSLALVYSSAGGKDLGGYGWSLTLPSIERAPLAGPPGYQDGWTDTPGAITTADRFTFEGQPLVPICTIPDAGLNCYADRYFDPKGGNYEPFPSWAATGEWTFFRLEAGSPDVRFFWSGDHKTWIVQYKSGETLELGHPLGSDASGAWFGDAIDWDLDHPQSAFRWNVARQYDAELQSGVPVNRILYQWQKIAGDTRLYLTDVFYTALGTAAASYPSSPGNFADHVHLAYDTVFNQPAVPSFVAPIWRSSPNFVLSRVDVTAAASSADHVTAPVARRLARRYALTHGLDQDGTYSKRVLLYSVQIEGRCATAGVDMELPDYTVSPTSNCPKLPPTQYGYQAQWPTFVAQPLTGSIAPNVPGTFIYDANSDGVPDVLVPNTPAGTTFPTSFSASLVNWGTLGAAQSMAVQLPAGFSTSLPAYPQLTFSNGNSPTPSQTIPGNFLGDAKLNMMMAGEYSATSGLQFALLSPSTQTGAFAGPAPFFLPTWLSSTRSSGGGVGDYYAFAESVLAVVDVDGDGYPDAITDTPSTTLGPGPQGSDGNIPSVPFWHTLSLRTTIANYDGSLAPFQRVKPGAYNPATSPLPLSLLPANGQYYANLATYGTSASNPAPPDTRLFAEGSAAPPLVLFEDMNSDGIVDWVTIDNVGGKLLYWIGHADGTFGSCTSGKNDCTGDARFQGTNPGTSMPGVPVFPPASKVLMHDVTGDGYADLVLATSSSLTIYESVGGTKFDKGEPVGIGSLPTTWSLKNAQMFFGDMNGSGVDDLVIVQDGLVTYVDAQSALRPGLLTSITNGYGATTTIDYLTTPTLAHSAATAGLPWTTSSPQILHHVIDIKSTNGMPAPFGETREVDYSYQNPIYDGRDRQFVGFEQVTARTIGDANEPTMTTQTTYLSGMCAVDGGTSCSATGSDRPFLALRGRPTLTSTFDDTGHHVSSTHTQYDVHTMLKGMDGRGVRFAYPSTVDTYLDDSSAAYPRSAGLIVTDAMFDDSVAQVTSHTINVARGSGGFVQTQVRQTRDRQGNLLTTTDNGAVSGVGGPPRGGAFDSPISVTYAWEIPAGDPTAFQWRAQTITRAAFPSPAGATSADLPLAFSFAYYPDGQVSSATTALAGALPLVRSSIGAVSPTTASANGAALTTTYFYDPYGNGTYVVEPGGASCAETDYDRAFFQFATGNSVFRDGCSQTGIINSAAAVVTMQSFDRGFEEPLTRISATGAITTYGYDGFGRVATVSLPDPTTGAPSAAPTVKLVYYDNTATPLLDTGYPVKQTSASVVDGSATRQFWTYTDAWGQPLVRLAPGDVSQGDASAWIARGQSLRTARGAVTRSYAPYFWKAGTDPSRFAFNAAPTSAFATSVYDSFGRIAKTIGLDNSTTTSVHTYHALEKDVQDAEQLSGSHVGASSYTVWDGHNRVARTGSIVRPDGSTTFDEQVLSTAYTASGKPWVITQSHSADATVVRRSLQYDSLGHLVGNVEPNTSTTGVGWRYAYDGSGRMVGTSDDNGCGENLAYDGIGRLVWEDYSPCTSTQATYSAAPHAWTVGGAPPATTSGVEALYVYDQGSSTVLSNQLSQSYDRAAHSSYAYDARGRVTSTARSLAAPEFVSSVPIGSTSNYSPYSFGRLFQYDSLNRLVAQSTGADVAQLLGTDPGGAGRASWESVVTASYSARGAIASVQGSYGTLLKSNVVDADGAPLTAVLGDAAGTTSFRCYDSLRQVSEVGVSRNTGLPSCAHAALGLPAKTVSTPQTKLIDDFYYLDKVGNPIGIADKRIAGEWSPGAMPVVGRTMLYDDSYRLTQIKYAYATTSSNDTYVPLVPTAAGSQNPMTPIAPATARVREQDYAYDWLGNTTSTTDDEGLFFERGLPTIQNGTASAGPNRLVSGKTAGGVVFSGGKASGGATNVGYDNAGNVISVLSFLRSLSCQQTHCSESFTFEWDEVGQLSHAVRYDDRATSPSADARYAYKANGERVLRESRQPNGRVAYSAEVFPSLRLDNAEWDAGTRTYQRDETTETAYLTFAGGSYGKILYAAPSSVTPATPSQHVFLTVGDALGSTSAVVDKATGELVERVTYYAYGGVESDYHSSDWQSFAEDYKYTGKEDDAEMGITNFGARYYSRFLGRWLSPDPLAIHGIGGDPNPYAFVRGNPLAYVDPDGLDTSGCDNLSAGCHSDDGISLSGTWDWAKKAASDAGKWIKGAAKTIGNDIAGAAKAVANAVASGVSAAVNAIGDVLGDIGHGIECLFGCADGHAPHPPPPPPSTASPWAGSPTLQWVNTSNNPVAQYLRDDRALARLQTGIAEATIGTELALATGGIADFLGGAAEGAELIEGAEGLEAAEGAEATESCAGGLCENGACFAGETLVAAEGADRPIRDVTVGDRVWAWNPDTRTLELAPVTRRFVTAEQPLVDIAIASPVATSLDVVRATPTHPFWVEQRGWTAAGDLRPGDTLRLRNGGAALVESITPESGRATVYNLEIQGDHTYFVGAAETLVHNACGGESDAARIGREMHKEWQPPEGFEKEVRLASGKRVDALNRATREVIELKPGNKAAIRRGVSQLRGYIQELGAEYGGEWSGWIQTY